MDEAMKKEVEALIAGANKGVSEQVAKLAEAVTPLVNSNLAAQLAELAKNQKVLADTMAADKKAAAEAAKGTEGKEAKENALTPEAVQKLIADALAAQQKITQSSAAKTAARQKIIDTKLKEVPPEFLAALPDTDNEAELAAAADKIVARVNEVLKVKQPDLGGAAGDGGKTAGSQGAGTIAALGGMSEGTAKFAQSIKLPDAPATSPAAVK